MFDIKTLALLKHGKVWGAKNIVESALLNKWGGGASYEKTVGPAPILSISDAKAKPAKSLIVGMEPIQDLHGYEAPWPAGGGVNQWDEEWENGRINVDTGNNSSGNGVRSKNQIPVKPSTAYHAVSGAYTGAASITIFYYDSNGDYVSYENKLGLSINFTTPSNVYYMRFNVMTSSVITTYNNDIAINYPSTVTTYAPYSNLCPITGRTGVTVDHSGADTSDPQTYHVVFPDAVGTVYGGTVDVVSGVLTVTHGMVDLGTMTWTTYSSPDRHVFRSDYPTPRPYVGSHTLLPHAICSAYYPMAYNPISASANGAFSLGGERVVIIDHRFTDASLFATAVQGVQLVYELATPQTYQLTPQQIQLLKGENVLWSDADDLTLTYIGTQPAGLLGGGFGGAQEPTEESEEPTEEPVSEEQESPPDEQETEETEEP